MWRCLIPLCALTAVGCTTWRKEVNLPSADQLVRDQLVINSDFHMPRRHRLLDELTARREDIARRLLLPVSDEPINVYLFEDEKSFRRYMTRNHPDYPERRAFFVKNDTTLKVFAFWGDDIADDLRHEVAHGYLHAVVPNLPLWLDEGLAEYFEVARGLGGYNRRHVYQLSRVQETGQWQPDLQRLEGLRSAEEMTQQDYAEAWLWVHYLMESAPQHRRLIQQQLAELREQGTSRPLSEALREIVPDSKPVVVAHLHKLAEQL